MAIEIARNELYFPRNSFYKCNNSGHKVLQERGVAGPERPGIFALRRESDSKETQRRHSRERHERVTKSETRECMTRES